MKYRIDFLVSPRGKPVSKKSVPLGRPNDEKALEAFEGFCSQIAEGDDPTIHSPKLFRLSGGKDVDITPP